MTREQVIEEKSIITSGMFTSRTDEWETPQYLFDELNEQFGFETDVCALPGNTKCAKYFTPEQDGLSQEWSGVCWMNPPYGRQIKDWVKKAYESAQNNRATVVCLLPARTDTSWWHDYCMKGEIRYIRGRLKFGKAKNSAPFPSAIVVFRAASLPMTDPDTGLVPCGGKMRIDIPPGNDSVRASTGFQRDGGDKTERRCNQCVSCGAEMPEGDQVCGYCRRKHGY
jgi:phage N-6-adenine-methyltransferase